MQVNAFCTVSNILHLHLNKIVTHVSSFLSTQFISVARLHWFSVPISGPIGERYLYWNSFLWVIEDTVEPIEDYTYSLAIELPISNSLSQYSISESMH